MNTHKRVTMDTNNNSTSNNNIKNNFSSTTSVINSRQRTIQYTTLSFSSRFQVSFIFKKKFIAIILNLKTFNYTALKYQVCKLFQTYQGWK